MNDSPRQQERSVPRSESLLTHLRVSVIATVVLAVVVCGIYPAVVWGLGQLIFPSKANGSFLKHKDGKLIGSALIGQPFSDAKYFHPRPSAAGNGYDATQSGGTNLGPMSAKLFNGTIKKDDKGKDAVDFDGLRDRIVHYCDENGLAFESSQPLAGFRDAKGNLDDVKLIEAFNDGKSPLTFKPKEPIPADAVTASASGLDPHISPRNAEIQSARVAAARKMPIERVRDLIARYTEGRDLGVLGDPAVNVVKLNLALDGEK